MIAVLPTPNNCRSALVMRLPVVSRYRQPGVEWHRRPGGLVASGVARVLAVGAASFFRRGEVRNG